MPNSASALEVDHFNGLFGPQISKESLSQQAYLAIRGSLMRSRLKPGQKLVARDLAFERAADDAAVLDAPDVLRISIPAGEAFTVKKGDRP